MKEQLASEVVSSDWRSCKEAVSVSREANMSDNGSLARSVGIPGLARQSGERRSHGSEYFGDELCSTAPPAGKKAPLSSEWTLIAFPRSPLQITCHHITSSSAYFFFSFTSAFYCIHKSLWSSRRALPPSASFYRCHNYCSGHVQDPLRLDLLMHCFSLLPQNM